MATLLQRLERSFKTTSSRSLALTEALKRRLSRRAHSVFVAAVPKSGSSFLSGALVEITGFVHHFLGQHYLAEHDLYLPRLLDTWSLDTVSHHHARANPHNIDLMSRFAIRPVILTRALDDCLVSLRDHLHKESATTPTFSVGPEFFELSEGRQFDAMVALAAPWYADFHAGWQAAIRAGAVDALWLTYDELMGDKAGTLEKVLDFQGIAPAQGRVGAALAELDARRERTRFNVGVSGRGREQLSEAQRTRLDALAGLYPWVDFSASGLPLAR